MLLQLLLPLLQAPGASTLSCESQNLSNFKLRARIGSALSQGPGETEQDVEGKTTTEDSVAASDQHRALDSKYLVHQ
jgi:hypothetical protein